MTYTEWKRKERVILRGTPVKWTEMENGKEVEYEISIFRKDCYGTPEYSLSTPGLGTIECTWSLDKIRRLVVD